MSRTIAMLGVIGGLIFNTALAADSQPPPTPVTYSATATDCGEITLTWESVSDGGSKLADYTIYMWGTQLLGTQGTSTDLRNEARVYAVSGLAKSSIPLLFSVAARDSAGNVSALADFNVVETPDAGDPLCADQTPPPSLDASRLSIEHSQFACGTVAVRYDGIAKDENGRLIRGGNGHYSLYRDGKLVDQMDDPESDHLVDHRGVLPGSLYRYHVTVTDVNGNESEASETFEAFVQDCTAPRRQDAIRTMILGVTFNEVQDNGWPAPTMNELNDAVFGTLGNRANLAAYIDEVSYGSAYLVPGGAHGKYTLGSIWDYCSSPTGDTSSPPPYCDTSRILADALALAGADENDADRIIVFIDGALQWVAGQDVAFVGTAIPFQASLTHEFLHTFGLSHAGLLSCRESGVPGHVQDVNDPRFGCSIVQYGDPLSPMGSAPVLYHIPVLEKLKAGFIDISELNVAAMDGISTHEISSVETRNPSLPRGLLVPVHPGENADVKGPLYAIEYRNATGFNGPVHPEHNESPTLQVRLLTDRATHPDIDGLFIKRLTPADPILVDEEHGITIELLSMNGDWAAVRVIR